MEHTAAKIILYGHTTCPGVPPARGVLNRANVPYDYINIHKDAAAAAQVRAINEGNESVPTLLFPDGSTLTEPSFGALRDKLNGLGYKIGWQGWLIGNLWRVMIAVGVGVALLRIFEVI